MSFLAAILEVGGGCLLLDGLCADMLMLLVFLSGLCPPSAFLASWTEGALAFEFW